MEKKGIYSALAIERRGSISGKAGFENQEKFLKY